MNKYSICFFGCAVEVNDQVNAFMVGVYNGFIGFVAGMIAGLKMLFEEGGFTKIVYGIKTLVKEIQKQGFIQFLGTAAKAIFKHFKEKYSHISSSYDLLKTLGEDLIEIFLNVVLTVQLGQVLFKKLKQLLNKMLEIIKNPKASIADFKNLLDKSLKKGKRFAAKGAQYIDDLTKSFCEAAGLKVTRVAAEAALYGQSKNYTCVASALRMVLEGKGKPYSEAYIARALETSESGALVLDIPKALESMYLGDIPVISKSRIKLAELIAELSDGSKAIVSVFAKGKGYHALIVDGVKDGMIFIRDPLPIHTGRSYTCSVGEFETIFTEKAILFK